MSTPAATRILFAPSLSSGDYRLAPKVGRVKLIRRGHHSHWVCRRDPDDGYRFIIHPNLLSPPPQEPDNSIVPTNT